MDSVVFIVCSALSHQIKLYTCIVILMKICESTHATADVVTGNT